MAVSLTITSDLAMPLSAETLPRTVTLTAAGVDSADGSASFNYSWHIIDKPPGSATVLSALVGTNVSLDVDTWGTYRVFCIATNAGTNESSEDNPYAAPLNSFFNIQIESVNFDLEKPAKSQRNWHPQYWHLVDVVENMSVAPADYINGGTVEIATPVEIAQGFGRQDSSSGEHYLAVTAEDLLNVLHPTANGALLPGQNNVFRNGLKLVALEQINESSITELKDVDTTTQTPTAGQALIWSPTHVDDTNGDVGAWIPGDITGISNLFGAGLCAGETLDTGDILIYREDCQEVPVAGPIPGWHARNRYNGEGFALNFPFASFGRAGVSYMATAEANGLGTWDDNREAVGQVAIASIYNTARGRAYDTDVYSTTAQAGAANAIGQLPVFAMSPENFAQCFIGSSFAGPSGTIRNIVNDLNKDGERIALYDPTYHTAAEIADLVADAADPNGIFDGTGINLIQQALTTHHLLRLGRSSITRLMDVDTFTHAPVDNDFLVWDSAHVDDGGFHTGAWIPKSAAELGLSGGTATLDKIEEGNTLVETIDTGSNGHIVFQTEGTERWHIETAGHLIPQANSTYDIGEAENKVRHFYLSNNSLKFGPSDTTTISAEFGVDTNAGNIPEWTVDSVSYNMPTYTGTPLSDQILKFTGGQWTLSPDSGGGVTGLTSNETDEVSLDSGFTFLPAVDNTLDLGNTSQRFRRVYSNEVIGDTTSTDGLYTKLSLNAEIPGSAALGLRAAALYSRGSIAMMLDTNNAGADSTNSFIVYEGGEDDSNATERFRVENDGQVKINNSYYLPTSDGSPNQILQTNGSGQLSFVDNTASGSSIEGTFDQCHLGAFTDEVTYNQSGYTIGVGRSPVMFMFRNPFDVSLSLKEFTFTCAHMHSSTLQFSFAICTHAQLLQNIYQTNSQLFTLTKVNIDPNTNNEGIGSLEGQIGNQLQAGEYLVVLLNGFEKTGQDNERFFINIEYTD